MKNGIVDSSGAILFVILSPLFRRLGNEVRNYIPPADADGKQRDTPRGQ
jgi:hypothetical protein